MTIFSEKKEFLFRKEEFNQVRSLLHTKTGIRLADSKDSMVYSRLSRRLRALKLTSFSEYLKYLTENSDNEEQLFINALTTNLTSFFREKHHFPILTNYLKTCSRPVKIWCAASSTGEEPYSIAMSVVEAFDRFDPQVEIIASDIDSTVLQQAQTGVYDIERIDNLSLEDKKRFFYKGVGKNAGKVRVVSELRNLVTFKKINLTHVNWGLTGPIDIIFCRNVMIYFDRATQLSIMGRMVNLMSPQGLYFAGHSETFSGAEHLIRSIGNTVYQPV